MYPFLQATKNNCNCNIVVGNFVILIVIGKIKCNCNLIVIDINVIDPCLMSCRPLIRCITADDRHWRDCALSLVFYQYALSDVTYCMLCMTGFTGAQGQQGEKGFIGATGLRGFTGPRGAILSLIHI